MRIAFLNPPFIGRFSRSSRSPAVAKGGTLYYPLWLAYAAGTAEDAGHDVQLIDAPAEGLDIPEVLRLLDSFSPQLIVVDTSTPSIFSDVNVGEEIKKQHPDAFIILVGTHPSALPEETLRLSDKIDAVAIGEYDFTIRDLAAAIEGARPLEEVDGLAFKKAGGCALTNKREKIKDLDSIPFISKVYKKHLKCRNYFFAAANHPMVQIITGRGCPHKCFFCVYPQVFHSRLYRTRSPENVVEEFRFIKESMPEVREIGIEDDCFTANPKHVRRICELLLQQGIKMRWYCNARGDVDFELLKLMKKAGCRLVIVGFESGCQQVLDGMHKGAKVERYIQFVKDAKRAGLLVHGCIMAGNPGDTKATLAETYEFAKRVDCDSMQFYPVYVYPGTEAYAWALENGYLGTTDFSKWVNELGLHNCVLSTPEFSADELVNLCDLYLEKYHLRPSYIAKKLVQAICHPAEGARTFKSAKVFFGKIFAGQLGANH